MKIFIVFLFFGVLAFSATCKSPEILGVFPKLKGVGCDSYARMLALASAGAAFLFWSQVTK